MKKLFTTLFFIFGVMLIASSQNYLTIGQVYNFNVGDVFESECGTTANSYPPNFYLTIVLAKWYSFHSDTVFYKDSSVAYTPPACMSCVGSFSTGVATIYYTHLNSRATQDTLPNECPAVWDSVYIGYCGKKVWEQGPSKSCLDTLPITFDGHSMSHSWLIEGCGGPYNNIFFEGESWNDYCSLVYYKKHDTTCGTEYIITGINQLNQITSNFKIYPNPSDGKFTIQTSEVNGRRVVEVYNVLGENVYSQFNIFNSTFVINLSSQRNGVYFCRVISDSGGLLEEGKLILQR